MDFGDPPTCSPLGDLHRSESTNKDYIPRGRCLLHRTLFHFPRIPGVGSGFNGASNGESQSSVLLQIGQIRTLSVPCLSPRPSYGIYLKEDVSILMAGCKSGQFFFERHLGYVFRFSTHFWDFRNTKQDLQRFVSKADHCIVYCKRRLNS